MILLFKVSSRKADDPNNFTWFPRVGPKEKKIVCNPRYDLTGLGRRLVLVRSEWTVGLHRTTAASGRGVRGRRVSGTRVRGRRVRGRGSQAVLGCETWIEIFTGDIGKLK